MNLKSDCPFLLIHPGPYRASYANLPQGLGIIAGILELNGVPVFVKDYMAEILDADFLVNLIKNNNIKVIGFSFMTPQAPWAYKLLEFLKNKFPEIIYICGGAHPTFMTSEVLNNGFDFAFRRESEETIISFLDALLNNNLNQDSLINIKGISFLKDGKNFSAGPAERIKNLDEIPFPARHLFPFPQNYKPQIPLRKGFCAQFFTSRGCPDKCKFCAQPYPDGVYYRSPQSVVDEIGYVKRKFNISHFYINDDTFCQDNARAIAISNLMIKRNINLPWVASFARIEPVSLDMFLAMRHSGCLAVTFGIESGDPEVRKDINKSGSLNSAIKAIRLAQKAKLIAGATFVFGHPKETLAQAKKTIDFAHKLNADYNKFFINTPYPGSVDYAYFKRQGLLLSDSWQDYWIQERPIIRTEYLTTKELLSLKKIAFIKIHTNPRWWMRQISNLLRTKNINLGIRTAINLILELMGINLAPKEKLLNIKQ